MISLFRQLLEGRRRVRHQDLRQRIANKKEAVALMPISNALQVFFRGGGGSARTCLTISGNELSTRSAEGGKDFKC